MSAKPIVAGGGKMLGYLQETPTEILLLASGGKVLGRYVKASDQTLDAGGKFIGYGNQLLTLLE
jgi:hypothetical protein